MSLQALRQLPPPLLQQLADAGRTAAAELGPHAFDGRPFATRQHRIRRLKNVRFRYPERHALPLYF
ncbi:MAG: hypothetical protein RSP_15590 [Rhodanobacter sp.]